MAFKRRGDPVRYALDKIRQCRIFAKHEPAFEEEYKKMITNLEQLCVDFLGIYACICIAQGSR